MQRLRDTNMDNPALDMPEVDDAASYLLGFFFEWGIVKQTGTGILPLDWVDMRAWAEVKGLSLSPWEATTLIEMSQAYAVELSHASSPTRPAPYRNLAEPEQVAKNLANQLDNLFKNRPGVIKKGAKK